MKSVKRLNFMLFSPAPCEGSVLTAYRGNWKWVTIPFGQAVSGTTGNGHKKHSKVVLKL